MASSLKNLSEYSNDNLPDGSSYKIGVIVSEWNEQITSKLFDACQETLKKHSVKEDNITKILVPGAFELTVAAKMLLKKAAYDAIICLGCVIKGETAHNEYINQSVAQGLTTLGLATGVPCIFGLLTPNDQAQAEDRAGGKHGNKGVEAAVTALRMAAIKKELQKEGKKIGF